MNEPQAKPTATSATSYQSLSDTKLEEAALLYRYIDTFLNNKLDFFNRGVNDMQQKVKKLEKESKNLTRNIENQKINVIEILGIFISIFTFISVDIQIFKDQKNPFILTGFILVMLGSLILFNLMLKSIIKSQFQNWIVWITSLILILGGVFLIFISGNYSDVRTNSKSQISCKNNNL